MVATNGLPVWRAAALPPPEQDAFARVGLERDW